MPVKPIPDGCHSVNAYLIVDDAAKAIDFYRRAFDAREIYRLTMPGGGVGHAEIEIGDTRVLLADESPQRNVKSPRTLGGSSVHLLVYLADADAAMKQALAAGATETRPIQDQFYGDRSGTITDPFGHLWTLATHIEDVSAAEMQRRLDAMMQGG
jgi:PhnB protein